jgi:hypothetical protein
MSYQHNFKNSIVNDIDISSSSNIKNVIIDEGVYEVVKQNIIESDDQETIHIKDDVHFIANPIKLTEYSKRHHYHYPMTSCTEVELFGAVSNNYAIKQYIDNVLDINNECENFNPSMLHALFDQYLFPHCGNNPSSSVKFFMECFSDYTKQNDIDNNFSNNVSSMLQKTLEFNKKVGYDFYDIADLFPADRYTQTEKQISWKRYFMTYFVGYNNFNNYYDEKYLHQHFFKSMYKQSIVYLQELSDTEYIYTSGYIGEFGGHMICFYINKIETNIYEAFITNTGEGINNHNNMGNKTQCIVMNIITEKQFKKLRFFIQMFNQVLISDIELFYDILKVFVGFNITESAYKITNNQDYVTPQLSGSCTYFSLLYIFKILFNKYKIKSFDLFNKHVQDISVNKLTTFIRDRYIKNKYLIPYNIKTFIDILPGTYNNRDDVIEIKQYYNKCVRYYIDTCFQGMSFASFNDYIQNNYNYTQPDKTMFNITNCDNVYNLFNIINNIFYDAPGVADPLIYNLIIAIKILNKNNKKFYKVSDQKLFLTTFSSLLTSIKLETFQNCNYLTTQIFLLLLNINEHNNYFIFKLIDLPQTLVLQNEFTFMTNIFDDTKRTEFICKYIVENINNQGVKEEDVELLIKYKHLLLADVSYRSDNISITDLAQYIVLDKKHKKKILKFILRFNNYTYQRSFKFNTIKFNEDLSFARGAIAYYNTKDTIIPKMDNDNLCYHKLIQVMQANKNFLELNNIESQNIKLTDVILPYEYVYGNYIQNKGSAYKELAVINLSYFIDYNNFSNILNNIMLYKIHAILLVCSILIKNNINYIRNFKEKLSELNNYKCSKINRMCIKFILGCIDTSKIININVSYIEDNYNTNPNLLLFFNLYLSTISLEYNVMSIVYFAIVNNTNLVQKNIKKFNKKFCDKQYIITSHDENNFICTQLDSLIKINAEKLSARKFNMMEIYDEYLYKNYIYCEDSAKYLVNITSGNKLYVINDHIAYIYYGKLYVYASNYENIMMYDNSFIYNIAQYVSSLPPILFYNKTENKILILMPNIYYENNEIMFVYDVAKSKLLVILDEIEYDVIIASDASNSMYVRWIYMIPFCLLIKKDGVQSIFLMHNNNKYFSLFNLISKHITHDTRQKKVLNAQITSNQCHIIGFKPFGLSLRFPDIDSYKKYIFLCMIFSRSDCLKIILPEFLGMCELNDTFSFDIILRNLMEEGFNNLYGGYFKYIWKGNGTYFNMINNDVEYNNNYNIKYFLTTTYQDVRIPNIFPNIKHLNSVYEYLLKSDVINFDDKISSLENKDVRGCINEYNKIYNKCKNQIVNVTSIEIMEFGELIKNEYEKIFYMYVHNGENITNTIMNNSKLFYDIIDYETCNKFQKALNTNKCDEVRKIYDMIDTRVIYTDENRNMEVVLFEIIFGKLIRRDQFNLYNNMYDQMTTANNKSVYQMLMGKGKSSVITPLLTIKLSYSHFNNIFIILPKHLIKQATIEMYDYLKVMMCTRIKYKKCPSTNEKTLHIVESKSIKKNILANNTHTTDIYNSAYIIDEFDNLYDPLSCELNSPVIDSMFSLENKNPFGIDEFNTYITLIVNLFNKYKTDRERKENIEKECTSIINEYNIKYEIIRARDNQYYIEEYHKKLLIIKKLLKTLVFCVKSNYYNRSYGFPTNNSHDSKFYAVPYEALNKPVPGSYFSNLDINVTLTILSYLNRNTIIEDDIKFTAEKIRLYGKLQIFFDETTFYKKLKNKYGKIIDAKHHYSILNNVSDIHKIIYSEYISTKNAISDNKNIVQYLRKIIIPSITFTTKQHNCAFIDIINKHVMQYKVGFSGTINIDLPVWENNNLEFTNIIPEIKDIGSTYFSLLGLDNNNANTFISNESDSLKFIIDIINEYKYNCLIDCGALLKEYTHPYIINQIKNNLYHRYLIYIDEHDNKIVFDKFNNKSYNYSSNKEYLAKDLFIYYDNRNTVGVDIKQPFVMKGLVTIDSANNFTVVSQGMYRLRNLNYGHVVDIILSAELNNKLLSKYGSNQRIKILDHLLSKDIIYKNIHCKRKLAIQNAKYIYRLQNNFNKNTYLEKKVENENYLMTNNNNFINTLKEDEPDNDIKKIYNKIHKMYSDTLSVNIMIANFENEEENEDKSLDKEQEEEQEQEQEQEQENEQVGVFTDNVSNKINILDVILHSSYYQIQMPETINGANVPYISYFWFNNIYMSNNINVNNYCNSLGYNSIPLGYAYFTKNKCYYITELNELLFIENMSKINNDDSIIVWKNNFNDNVVCDKSLIVKLMCGFKLNLINLIKTLISCFNDSNPAQLAMALSDYNKCFCNLENKMVNEYVILCLMRFRTYDTFKRYIMDIELNTLYYDIVNNRESANVDKNNNIFISNIDNKNIKKQIKNLFTNDIYIK